MRKIAIIGMSMSSRHNAPWYDKSWELWGLNESYAYAMKEPLFWPDFELFCEQGRVTWFQMHPRWDYTRPDNHNDPNHWAWLQNKKWTKQAVRRYYGLIKRNKEGNPPQTIIDKKPKPGESMRPTNFPIYMLEAFEDIPGAVEYPYDEIQRELMVAHARVVLRDPSLYAYDAEPIEYATSTMAHAIALAALLAKRGEVEVVGLWGIDAASNTEYAYQKGSIEFWLGKLGAYCDVMIDSNSSLLKGLTYGYEGVRTLSIDWYRNRLEFLRPRHDDAVRKYQELNKEFNLRAATIKPADFEEMQVKQLDTLGDFMTYWGAVQYCEQKIKTLEARDEESPGMIRQIIELEYNQLQREADQEMGELNRLSKEHEIRVNEWLNESRPGARDSKKHHAEKAWQAMAEQLGKVSLLHGVLQEMRYEMATLDMQDVNPELVHRITAKRS